MATDENAGVLVLSWLMKEHIQTVVKLAISLLILNAILDVAAMFGFGMARQVINNPISSFTNKSAPASGS